MTALTTNASLVELAELDETSQITATIERSELEELLAADTSHQLWLDVGIDGEAEPLRLNVELTEADLRALLEDSQGDEITIAVDGGGIASLLEEPDVEAHGMRAALAVALATAAIAAPSALAASPQTVGSAAAGAAASSQVVSSAVSSQQTRPAATTQVSSQVVRTQVTRSAAKSAQVTAAKLSRLTILQAGVVR